LWFGSLLCLIGILLMMGRYKVLRNQMYQMSSFVYLVCVYELAYQILTTFQCVWFIDEWVLADDYSRTCSDSESDSYFGSFIFGFATPIALFLLVAIPVILSLMFYKKRGAIQEVLYIDSAARAKK